MVTKVINGFQKNTINECVDYFFFFFLISVILLYKNYVVNFVIFLSQNREHYTL